MAKKTNKTEHVLNLISKAKETNQTEDDDVVIETIDSKVTPDLAFVDLQLAHDTELSEKIKENLVHEIEAVQTHPAHEPQSALEKVVMDAAKAIVDEEEPSAVDERSSSGIEEPVKEQESYVMQSNHKDVQVESLPDLDMGETIVTPDATVKVVDEPDINQAAGQGYCYVNILESIVKERVETYMRRFGVCTCPRCVADTIALTLNGLPPKYVVADHDAISPMLNYFDTHYAGAVTTQLSRACVIVKNNPYH